MRGNTGEEANNHRRGRRIGGRQGQGEARAATTTRCSLYSVYAWTRRGAARERGKNRRHSRAAARQSAGVAEGLAAMGPCGSQQRCPPGKRSPQQGKAVAAALESPPLTPPPHTSRTAAAARPACWWRSSRSPASCSLLPCWWWPRPRPWRRPREAASLAIRT